MVLLSILSEKYLRFENYFVLMVILNKQGTKVADTLKLLLQNSFYYIFLCIYFYAMFGMSLLMN